MTDQVPPVPTPPAGFDPDAGDFQNVSPATFTQVPKASHRRGPHRLASLLGLGVLTLYLSNKTGWKPPPAEELAAEWSEGAGRIRQAVVDLERAGFLVRFRKQVAGGHWKTVTVISADPKSLNEIRAYAIALTAHQDAAKAARKAAGRTGSGRAGQVAKPVDHVASTSADATFPQVGPDGGFRDSVHRDSVHRVSVQGDLSTEDVDLEDQEKIPPTPGPVATAAAAAVEVEAGGDSDPSPELPQPSALDTLVLELVRLGGWDADATRDVLAQLVKLGRDRAEIKRVALEVAAGLHGTTQSPRRLLAWWPKPAGPAEAEPEWTRGPVKYVEAGTPMCRRHRGEPEATCGKCKVEKFSDPADVQSAEAGPATTLDAAAARELAREHAAAARTARGPYRQRRPEPIGQTGPDPQPAGALFGAIAAAAGPGARA
jgi:hypothetical protein